MIGFLLNLGIVLGISGLLGYQYARYSARRRTRRTR